MKSNAIAVALLSGLTVATSIALAADPFYPSNPEKSFTIESMVATVTKPAAGNEAAVAQDRWQETNAEQGSSLTPPKYVRVGGKLVNGDAHEYVAPKPSRTMSTDEKIEASVNYRNAP